MALPSSSRPPSLGVQLVEQVQVQRKKIKLTWTPTEYFLRIMADWYINLRKAEKRTLSPKKFKRKAVKVCADMAKSRWEGMAKIRYDELPLDWVQQCKQTIWKRYEEREIRKGDRLEFKLYVKKPKVDLKKPSSSTGSEEGNRKTGYKKFVDLTMEPPPPSWIGAYAKGVVLPRVLSLHSTEDSNILFYDYNPKLKDDFGKVVKLVPQPRFNCLHIHPE